MAGPVNQIFFKHDPSRTLGRDVVILIDNQELTDLIAEAAGSWQEKRDARVHVPALQQSRESSGSFKVLICANCAAAGHITAEDISLRPFEINHDGEFVSWKIALPEVTGISDKLRTLELRFHRPQYMKQIDAITFL